MQHKSFFTLFALSFALLRSANGQIVDLTLQDVCRISRQECLSTLDDLLMPENWPWTEERARGCVALLLSGNSRDILPKFYSAIHERDPGHWSLSLLSGNAYPEIHCTSPTLVFPSHPPYETSSLAHWFACKMYGDSDRYPNTLERSFYTDHGTAQMTTSLLCQSQKSTTETLLIHAFRSGLPGYFRLIANRAPVLSVGGTESVRLENGEWKRTSDTSDAALSIREVVGDENSPSWYIWYAIRSGNVGTIEIILRFSKNPLKIDGVWVAFYS